MIGMPKPSPLPVLVLVAGILCCDFSNFMCVCCYSGCLLLNLCDISDTLLLGLLFIFGVISLVLSRLLLNLGPLSGLIYLVTTRVCFWLHLLGLYWL
jgi:hypothetical protein